MKRTFEGKVDGKIDKDRPVAEWWYVIHGNEYGHPRDWLTDQLHKHFGKEVRVSIEVEPVTLKDRIEKIFDDAKTLWRPEYAASIMDDVMRLVLAELEAYAK